MQLATNGSFNHQLKCCEISFVWRRIHGYLQSPVKSRWPPPPSPGPLTMLALIPRSVFRLEITTLVGGSGGQGEGMFIAKCPNYFGRDIPVKSRCPPPPGPLTMLVLIPMYVFRLEITTLVGGAGGSGERGERGAGERGERGSGGSGGQGRVCLFWPGIVAGTGNRKRQA